MMEEAFLGFVLFSVPALIYGILVVVPLLLFVLYQRFSHRYFPKLGSFIVIVTVIGAFAVALLFTTRSIINFSYAIEIPYGLEIPKNEAENKLFDSAVINEAIYRSLTPVYFQKPCIRTPKLVCQLGIKYAIDMQEYRIPFINGVVSAIISVLIGLRAQNWMNMRFRTDYKEILT